MVPDFINPQAFNRYSYCLNNPLKYIDPSGYNVIIGDTDVSDFEDIVDEIIWYEEWGVEPPPDLIEQLLEAVGGLGEGGLDLLNEWERYARENSEIAEMLEEAGTIFAFEGIMPGQPDRSYVQELFDSIGYQRAYSTTLHGIKLASMATSASLRFGPRDTLVFEDNKGIPRILLSDFFGKEALTIGYVIITTQSSIQPELLLHELGHVTQAAILGSSYIPAHILAALASGFDSSKNVLETGFLHPNWWRR